MSHNWQAFIQAISSENVLRAGYIIGEAMRWRPPELATTDRGSTIFADAEAHLAYFIDDVSNQKRLP